MAESLWDWVNRWELVYEWLQVAVFEQGEVKGKRYKLDKDNKENVSKVILEICNKNNRKKKIGKNTSPDAFKPNYKNLSFHTQA